MKFFRRSSTGSSSSLRASASTARSIAYVASGRPAPRYASVGVVFVKTPVHSKSYATTSYAPPYSHAPSRGIPDVAAVNRGEVSLAPRFDPLDRPPEPACEGQRERLLRVDVQLGAEAAADVRGDHAQFRLRHARDHRERDPGDVRDLG